MDGSRSLGSSDNVFEAFLKMHTDVTVKVAKQGADLENLKERVDRDERDRREEFKELREKVDRVNIQTLANTARLETQIAEHTNTITKAITAAGVRTNPSPEESGGSNFMAAASADADADARNGITLTSREVIIFMTAILVAFGGAITLVMQLSKGG